MPRALFAELAARSERQQMQDAFSLLDQAVTELEESRGQALVFKRVNGSKSDDLPFYDVQQLSVSASAPLVSAAALVAVSMPGSAPTMTDTDPALTLPPAPVRLSTTTD